MATVASRRACAVALACALTSCGGRSPLLDQPFSEPGGGSGGARTSPPPDPSVPNDWTSSPPPLEEPWSVSALAGDGDNLWLAAQTQVSGASAAPDFLSLTSEGFTDFRLPAQEHRSIWVSDRRDVFVTLQQGAGLSTISAGLPAYLRAPGEPLSAITGHGYEVWATRASGPATIYHWDGLDWQAYEFGPNLSLHDVQVGPDGSIWTVGDAGFMARLKDGNWSTRYFGTSDLFAIWPTGDEEVWVAGAEGTLLHRRNRESGWERTAMGSGSLHGLWGRAANDVWLVGDRGLVTHWDGRKWRSVDVSTSARLLAVTGTSDRIWIGGELTLLSGSLNSR